MIASRQSQVDSVAKRLKSAAQVLSRATPSQVDSALDAMANGLLRSKDVILEENARDVDVAVRSQATSAFVDRLRLNATRIDEMSRCVQAIRRQDSPLNRIVEQRDLPNGLRLEKRTVPIGVVLFIYESRPNVTTDAAAICLKSGNAVCLRGGSEAAHSNRAIGAVIAGALTDVGLPGASVIVLDDPDRQLLAGLLKANSAIDLVIPRGGTSLIRRVVDEATMPVLKHFQGICHVYVDKSADLQMAAEIIENSKCQRPGVCNAMETLLVHRDIAKQLLPALGERLASRSVEVRGCLESCALMPMAKQAKDTDFGFEFLDLILAVKVVADADAAIEHIARFGSGHTDSIVAADSTVADRFLQFVDSAVVLHNASTRFNDGAQLGMGAEIGISTDKLHARGPCGVNELTSYKYVVRGVGQIRT